MEESVSLVASDQLKFQKSIKGIKKLIKSGKIKPRTDKDARLARFPKKAPKKPKKERGLVYISHIPHGFYENEMTLYFRQFGVVTNARVLRSPRTGRAKGAAFVEFLEPSVAQIVAETMNNYLMGKRLLKAVLIPPEKQKANALRKTWNVHDNPSSDQRRKIKTIHNSNGTEVDDLKLARRQLKNVLETKRKLKEMGIDYDFFSPVDVPVELQPLVDAALTDQPQGKPQTEKNKAQSEKKEPQAEKNKPQAEKNKPQAEKNKPQAEKIKSQAEKKKPQAEKNKAQSEKKKSQAEENKSKSEKKAQAEKKEKKQSKTISVQNKQGNKINKKEPELSKETVKNGTLDFIKIDTKGKKTKTAPEDDTDSNDNFDSDEFEMTLESDGEEFGSDDDDDKSEDDASDIDGSGDSSEDDGDSSEEDAPAIELPGKNKKTKAAGGQTSKQFPAPNKKAHKPAPVSKETGLKRKPGQQLAVPAKKQKQVPNTSPAQSGPAHIHKKNKKGPNAGVTQNGGVQLNKKKARK